MVRSCIKSRHDTRRLSADVMWCARCGSYRRRYAADGGFEGWTRWVPCGVERLTPYRQLDLPKLSAAESDDLTAALTTNEQLHLPALTEESAQALLRDELRKVDREIRKLSIGLEGSYRRRTRKPTLRIVK
jgi:hypothetical protein